MIETRINVIVRKKHQLKRARADKIQPYDGNVFESHAPKLRNRIAALHIAANHGRNLDQIGASVDDDIDIKPTFPGVHRH